MSVKVLCDKHFIKWLSVSEKYGSNYLQSTCSEDTFNEIVIDSCTGDVLLITMQTSVSTATALGVEERRIRLKIT